MLIPYLAEEGLTWITKDDGARSRHRKELLASRISVVWIRGLDRQKNKVNPKQIHLMLTVRLDEIAAQVRSSRGPLYFLLYMNGERAGS